jgi:hypothetical protein
MINIAETARREEREKLTTAYEAKLRKANQRAEQEIEKVRKEEAEKVEQEIEKAKKNKEIAARKLFKAGMAVDIIADSLGLSIEEVQSLVKDLP